MKKKQYDASSRNSKVNIMKVESTRMSPLNIDT